MIQGSIIANSTPNAQEVIRREEEVTPIITEAKKSFWRGQWKQSSTTRMSMRNTSMMIRSNEKNGQNEILTPTPPNRKITVRKKNGVR